MKKFFTLFCIGLCVEATAQNKICKFDIPVMHNVYVFSENRNHTIIELFGERVPTQIMNIMYVTNEQTKNQTDSLCKVGQLGESIFIFPHKDASRTIRFCNDREYLVALVNKMELRIECK